MSMFWSKYRFHSFLVVLNGFVPGKTLIFPGQKILGQEISTYVDNPYKLIFWNEEKDDFITVSNVNCYLRRLNQKYKIAPTLQSHILRHTRITRLNEAGVDIMVIQSLVGHTIGSEITRLNYISISDDYIKSELTKINDL